MTLEDCIATCAMLTGMTRTEWAEFLSLNPEQQCAAAEAYRGQDWTTNPDTLGKVLSVLGAIATVASDASGVLGAYEALKAL